MNPKSQISREVVGSFYPGVSPFHGGHVEQSQGLEFRGFRGFEA